MSKVIFYNDNTADIEHNGSIYTLVENKNIHQETVDYVAQLKGETTKTNPSHTSWLKYFLPIAIITGVAIASGLGGYLLKASLTTEMAPKPAVQEKTTPSKTLHTPAGSGLYTCIPQEKGIICAGKNISGRLGVADPTERKTHLLTDKKITTIAASHNLACAGTNTGEIWCWGDNSNGIINPEKPSKNILPPTKVFAVKKPVTSLVLGAGYAAATDGSHIWAWGNNQYSQISSSGKSQLPVTEITGIPDHIQHLYSSGYVTWAWTEKSGYWAWGNNLNKEIFIMPADKHIKPTNIKEKNHG